MKRLSILLAISSLALLISSVPGYAWAKEHEKNQKFLETMLGKQTEKVPGRVIDEEGKPLAGVKWWISGIEELREGHWIVAHRSGIPRDIGLPLFVVPVIMRVYHTYSPCLEEDGA